MPEYEHHRDLAHEFPELKHRVHELKLASSRFRSLYDDYQSVDNEIHRIEQEIETPGDDYTERLKRQRVRLKDLLYLMLTGQAQVEAEKEEYVQRNKFRVPVDHGEVSRDWAERGYSCREVSDPPQTQRNKLDCKGDALIAVAEGKLAVTVHGEVYQIVPGDELFVPLSMRLRIHNIHSAETRWLFGCD